MQKIAAEYAPGLPDKQRFDRISQNGPTRLVFQRHKATADHYDMRLQDGDIAHSWVTRSLPGEKDKMLAIRQPTHLAEYSDFEGTIPKGTYGAGTVKKIYDKEVDVVKADNKKIKLVLPDGEWTMLNLKGDKNWLMVKNKHTIKNPIKTKPTYKDLKEKELDPNDNTKVWQPKVDGGHTIFRLRSDDINRVYSYRNRKNDDKPIEHTHQVPGIRDAKVPSELNNVEIRGELYAKGKDGKPMEAQEVTGLLNAGTMKSLEQQGLKGNLLPYLFSVTKWKGGKDVKGANYRDQIRMLKEVEKKVDPLYMAETAETPEEKREMLNSIKNKTHPDTVEGVVQWDLERSGGSPEKKKLRETHEVVIREIYPAATPKTGRKMAGGFRFSWTPEGPVVGNVGTGFKEPMRKEMLENPEKFVNRIARIKTQQVFKSGAARAPAFYQMHVEKNLEKVAAYAKTKLEMISLLKEANKDPMFEWTGTKLTKKRIDILLTKTKPMIHDGNVVGFTMPSKSKTGANRLGSIYVKKSERKKGYAYKTLKDAIKKSDEFAYFVKKENKPSIKLARKAGLKYIKRAKGKSDTMVFEKVAAYPKAKRNSPEARYDRTTETLASIIKSTGFKRGEFSKRFNFSLGDSLGRLRLYTKPAQKKVGAEVKVSF